MMYERDGARAPPCFSVCACNHQSGRHWRVAAWPGCTHIHTQTSERPSMCSRRRAHQREPGRERARVWRRGRQPARHPCRVRAAAARVQGTPPLTRLQSPDIPQRPRDHRTGMSTKPSTFWCKPGALMLLTHAACPLTSGRAWGSHQAMMASALNKLCY